MNIKDFGQKYIQAQTDAWDKGDFKLLEEVEAILYDGTSVNGGKVRMGILSR